MQVTNDAQCVEVFDECNGDLSVCDVRKPEMCLLSVDLFPENYENMRENENIQPPYVNCVCAIIAVKDII